MSFAMVEEPDFVRVTMSGVLTGEDLVALSAAADRIEQGRDRVPHRLADLRAVTEVRISYLDVQALAEDRRARRFPNSFKSAIIVSSSVQLGMASMFRTLNDNPQILIEIFDDDETARRWLRG